MFAGKLNLYQLILPQKWIIHEYILSCIDSMSSTLSYFTLMLYIAQSPGNPFLSFFIQSVTEIPAFFLATYMGEWNGVKYRILNRYQIHIIILADTLGRRWTNCSSFLLAAMFCIPTALLANSIFFNFVDNEQILKNSILFVCQFLNMNILRLIQQLP